MVQQVWKTKLLYGIQQSHFWVYMQKNSKQDRGDSNKQTKKWDSLTMEYYAASKKEGNPATDYKWIIMSLRTLC